MKPWNFEVLDLLQLQVQLLGVVIARVVPHHYDLLAGVLQCQLDQGSHDVLGVAPLQAHEIHAPVRLVEESDVLLCDFRSRSTRNCGSVLLRNLDMSSTVGTGHGIVTPAWRVTCRWTTRPTSSRICGFAPGAK